MPFLLMKSSKVRFDILDKGTLDFYRRPDFYLELESVVTSSGRTFSRKFRGRAAVGPARDSHGVHNVHLSLNTSAVPTERTARHVTPDRLTRDQATTFRPSDLPIGQQSSSARRSSAHSDVGSAHSLASGPLKTIGFGPPALLHTMSETRMLGNRRNLVSPSKVYAAEFTQLQTGDHFRRNNSGNNAQSESFYQEQGGPSISKVPGNNTARLGNQSQQQKSGSYLPGDRVIFAESPSAPGIPIVYRTSEERAANPDRLNLDRRRLTVCPILEGEEHLRLLNFQHNLITRIQHLSNLRRLIFLDLYDNQIEEMTGLSSLKSLRVLMLGKNRIRQISSLDNLVKLDVLDLHGNQIQTVENLSHLSELRVLNLAGNQIEHVSNLSGMDTLAELNLRRNIIASVSEVDLLTSLQRLFLSFNNISRWGDIECLSDASALCEISLDGNPISSDVCYKQIVLRSMPQLRQLDMKRISEDERRMTAVLIRKEEDRKREVHKQVIAKEKKRLAINNAARQWEAEHGGRPIPPRWREDQNLHFREDRGIFSQVAPSSGESSPLTGRSESTDKSAWLSAGNSNRSVNNNNNNNRLPNITSLDISESYLAEIDGENLQLFGPGALDSLDKNWGNQASSAVTTITIQFINFDDLCNYIIKIKNKFINAVHLILKEVNLHSLQQLNALSQMKRLETLSVECGPGNPVTQFSLWKSYVIFRLSHLSLAKLNGEEVSAADVVASEKIFGSLSLVTTSQLSQFRLVALLGETRQKQLTSSKESKKSKGEAESRLAAVESVGRAGLQYIPQKQMEVKAIDTKCRAEVARDIVRTLKKDVGVIASKQSMLTKLWPEIFVDLIKEAVLDMYSMEEYVKREVKAFEAIL
uniref:leucine-rich repeat-containing protein 49 isoform X2 n=1 Tax=Ciona intestinalis TaxID=7719 RepID=UPI000EF4FE72|nr:leucine-rich repeat-containing protein 49 isoform X2 [Ciona intestinalis]|eukprot:XP_026691632.1 leucine-rich repeat-containing protein 49 isoform X2 [Ciona intestinalis]